MLAEVCSHKMGATQVYGSSYTLSSDIIPTIEAQPVPKLRLSKIDKLGRSLMHSQHFSIDVSWARKIEKKTSGVSTSLGTFLRVRKCAPFFFSCLVL